MGGQGFGILVLSLAQFVDLLYDLLQMSKLAAGRYFNRVTLLALSLISISVSIARSSEGHREF